MAIRTAAAGIALLVAQAGPAPAPPAEPRIVPGGALDRDCSHVADGLGGPGYRFISGCPGRAASPDGRFAVSLSPQEGAKLVDASGTLLGDIPNLSDAMPFVIFWSPRSNWFFANHYLGSGLERLRVFEIVNRTAIERSSMFAAATREMIAHYPCLGRHASVVVASGWRWSRDGRRIAMAVYARPDSCHAEVAPGLWEPQGRWETLWMIGDAESGQIDPASVRVRTDSGPMPSDGPYAAF